MATAKKDNKARSRKYCVNLYGPNPKDPFTKRPYKCGQHGKSQISKSTPGAKARMDGQIVKAYYDLSESDFRIIVAKAKKTSGNAINNVVHLLESSPVSIAYKARLAPSIRAARQMVSHGQILLNGKKCTRKQRVKLFDVISISEKIVKNDHLNQSIANSSRPIPDYITCDLEKKSAHINRFPSQKECQLPDRVEIGGIISRY